MNSIKKILAINSKIFLKGFQKWIGYADIKSAPVYFYVQRNSTFNATGTPIPFEIAVVNEGNAMNLTSGVFTAPRSGIYFFSFTGQINFPASSSVVELYIRIYLNGGPINIGEIEETNTVTDQNTQVSIESTLNLKEDDQVWVGISSMSAGVSLLDSNEHWNHFTGFMLEEEIAASL